MKIIEKNTCPVNSYTEWERLEEVIVGNPENAFVSLVLTGCNNTLGKTTQFI